MMIDFAPRRRTRNRMSPRDAIFRASSAAFSTDSDDHAGGVARALPLMLSTGVGAELRRPLGIAMVGGLLVSRVLTCLPPVIYLPFDRLSLYVKSRFPP